MEAYMREHFPMVDADDAIQETLIALITVFLYAAILQKKQGHFTITSPAYCVIQGFKK